jgi:hypothetical protein
VAVVVVRTGSGVMACRVGYVRESGVLKCCDAAGAHGAEAEKVWSARRRDPRINGVDIYVARVTKVGMGSARPCWRCVVWCRWAGVKRIFHWNGEGGKFDVVKVNTAEQDQYETNADIRLYAGMVRWFIVLAHLKYLTCGIIRAGNIVGSMTSRRVNFIIV